MDLTIDYETISTKSNELSLEDLLNNTIKGKLNWELYTPKYNAPNNVDLSGNIYFTRIDHDFIRIFRAFNALTNSYFSVLEYYDPSTLKSIKTYSHKNIINDIYKTVNEICQDCPNESSFANRLMGLQSNLLNFAYTLTSNRDDAHDLLQDTTLKALDIQDKYVDSVNFKGWVYTIMRNIFANNYRKIIRNQTIIDQTEELYHLNLPQDSGIETTEGAYTINEIMKCIDEFTDDYRIPFSMHLSGFKYHEIAEKMNLSIGAVKSKIFFARKRLQETLQDYNR